MAARLSSPRMNAGAFRRDLVSIWLISALVRGDPRGKMKDWRISAGKGLGLPIAKGRIVTRAALLAEPRLVATSPHVPRPCSPPSRGMPVRVHEEPESARRGHRRWRSDRKVLHI